MKGEEAMKMPGEFQPAKPITKAEREARRAFRQVDAEKVMTEQEIAQKVFSDNRERLAREATGTPVAKTKANPDEEIIIDRRMVHNPVTIRWSPVVL